MKLNYHRINKPLKEDKVVPKGFMDDIKLIDNNLHIVFNRISGRWEVYRYSKGIYHWVLEVCNDDNSYRPLDNRTLIKLRKMDIIERWGSVAKYEKHLDEKQKKWQDDKQNEYDYELKCDLKDDRKLWQMAAENFRSGIYDNPPIQKDKNIFSYQKEEV